MSRSRSLKSILNPECDLLRNLVARAQRLQQLTQLVREALPDQEGSHVSAVVATKTGAIVWTDSAAWATRLRYRTDTVLERMRTVDSLRELQSVQVKVLPTNDVPPVKVRARPSLSEQSAHTLTACAACVSDAKLREALERLAANAQARGEQKTRA